MKIKNLLSHSFNPRAKKNKYNNKRTVVDGINFQSILEAKYYIKLKAWVELGEVVGFFRQVPLDLAGGIKYRMDFLIFFKDGTCECVDVKGVETKEFKLKKKLIEEAYPWLDLKITNGKDGGSSVS